MQVVTINNEQIAYEDIGSGEPIIFIHPPGMGRVVFEKQKPLSNQYRMIIPDLVGQGDSTFDGKSSISVKRFAKDIIELMDVLRIQKAVIFGYSAGGIITQFLGIHYPERIRALIISGAYPIVDNFTLKTEHQLGVYAIKKSKKFLSSVLAVSHTKNKVFRKNLKNHMMKSNSDVWGKYYIESLKFNCKNEINKIQMPVLILYGSKADYINMYNKFYKKHLPSLRVHFVQNESHQIPTRRSEEVNKVAISFLDELKE
ncbi:pimeloyl-ACP methyl ester carboxylesterase [Bacillus mesophilus]|uniref:Alpha/beta hydrolase n=1 Tax=Bacillus mesophilus TaxID=1808955 RepID=A0A6M0Q8U7_9BACI|nr:alpha/beta hydrolase [Bacillus mesophilus]MBM7661938.1 pimeloyl-ACP methyl ester carboxylesterase [Bacillus mesophilus]NEY72703.1 alpha/beta hydrolase [Bacillus mesophilus]